MQRTEVSIPGDRVVAGTLDEPGDRTLEAGREDRGRGSALVVACPPHPKAGGDRRDGRLRAVSEALVEAGVACLRFDYGPWAEGRGEVADARGALRWAAGRADRLGLFGYSFGGAVAVLAAAATDRRLRAVSLLAPGARISPDLDAVEALSSVPAPVQVVVGERDDTVDWEPLVDRARALDQRVETMGADHFFVGQRGKVADAVSAFQVANLAAPG